MSELFYQREAGQLLEFGAYTDLGIKIALHTIRTRYENDPAVENNLEFHNTQHTKAVIRRTEIILRSIGQAMYVSDRGYISPRDFRLGRLLAAYHDTVQRWEAKEKESVQSTAARLRVRFIPDNERESAHEAIAFMEKANMLFMHELFTPSNKAVAHESIMTTVPSFDTSLGTVVQPYLTQNSSVIAVALALADLGTAGMDGGKSFVDEGSALFREENLDITAALRSENSLSGEEQEVFRERILNWTNF